LYHLCEPKLRAFFAANPFSSLRDAKVHLQLQHNVSLGPGNALRRIEVRVLDFFDLVRIPIGIAVHAEVLRLSIGCPYDKWESAFGLCSDRSLSLTFDELFIDGGPGRWRRADVESVARGIQRVLGWSQHPRHIHVSYPMHCMPVLQQFLCNVEDCKLGHSMNILNMPQDAPAEFWRAIGSRFAAVNRLKFPYMKRGYWKDADAWEACSEAVRALRARGADVVLDRNI
jgi:hypothetical protein